MENRLELKLQTERCKSCGLCVTACPQGALSIGSSSNSAGYKCVALDKKKCITCGICYTACPDYVFTIEEVQG
ncbi:MAG: 4Fe-4S binding protein [Oscillospiraceae bacterium]|nr:4Fe-4S binding protein [Oscillospiraceae bacterium]